MAENILVRDVLSDAMIEAGARLVERLDANNAEIVSAFWIYFEEERVWQLMLSSPHVVTEGPKQFYRRVLVANRQAAQDESVISMDDIAVTGMADEMVQLVRAAIHTGKEISGIRFSRNTVNGIFIEDSYIYRSAA